MVTYKRRKMVVWEVNVFYANGDGGVNTPVKVWVLDDSPKKGFDLSSRQCKLHSGKQISCYHGKTQGSFFFVSLSLLSFSLSSHALFSFPR